jgi:hypothetical protein
MQLRYIFTLSTVLVACACSSDKPNKGTPSKTGGASNASGGSSSQPVGGSSSENPGNYGVGGALHTGPMFAGAECPTDLGFSDAYALPNVKGVVDGANARITFDPPADAKDYRVYVLPKKEQISGDVVKDAVYRCAGDYAVPFPAKEDSKIPDSPGIRTRVASKVYGYERKMEEATLGYVFTTPADDRVPVYALGDTKDGSDNTGCYFMRWPESRVKLYTTSDNQRTDLLGKRWRDDGVVFYTPKPGADGTTPIYTQHVGDPGLNAELYLGKGAEYDFRAAGAPTEMFSVYAAPQDGAEPLMRVHYEQYCGRGHDELAVGVARFNKAYSQGAQPVAELHYSGLSEETTLVVEALDQLCPFQGVVGPMARPARPEPDQKLNYPAFLTPDQLAAASPTGEVFINGEGKDTTPHAISRACVKLKPEEPPAMDFFYDGKPETFTAPVANGFQIWEVESPTFNVQLHTMATDEWSIGAMFGEFWATYSDWAADTNGKLRITPKQRATLASDSFLHASMEVDTVSTQRRYPQLLISTADWPVQDNLEKSSTVIVQMFGGITVPLQVQIEFCDHHTWDVNNQCPTYPLYTLQDATGKFLSPAPEINGFNGMDRTVRFDAFVATGRVYLYTNNLPYACVDLPDGKLGAGEATVTFGDVLYHSGVDLAEWYPFQVANMQIITSRQFSNLGFSSKVDAPPWDEARLPCVPASALK